MNRTQLLRRGMTEDEAEEFLMNDAEERNDNEREAHVRAIAEINENIKNQNSPGYNEYGVPLHALYGVRHDEHYWALMAHWNF